MASLSEELILLALDDKKGSVRALGIGEVLDIGLAGAQLLELVRGGYVTIEGGLVVPHDGATPPSQPALRRSLERIVTDRKARKPAAVVLKLTKGLRKSLLQQVAGEGLVSVERGRVLGILPRTRYPERDGRVEREVRKRLRSVILDGAEADERTVSLAAILKAAGMESVVLDRAERRACKARMGELASAEMLSKDVAKAVEAAVAATAAAVLTVTMVAAAGS